MFPSLRGRYDLAFADPADADLGACDVVFFATPHGVAMAQARELTGARREDHRPRRRFPAEGPGGLRAVVRHAARLPGPARRIGVRPAGGEPRGDPRRAHRRQSRLLPDRRPAGLPAAARSGHRRRRRTSSPTASRASRAPGARPRSGLLFAEASRQLQGLRRQGPPPSPGNRPGTAGRHRRAGEARLHAAPDADDPRHPRDAVRAAHRIRAPTCRRSSRSATPGSRSST